MWSLEFKRRSMCFDAASAERFSCDEDEEDGGVRVLRAD